jgi:hypothetical protein
VEKVTRDRKSGEWKYYIPDEHCIKSFNEKAEICNIKKFEHLFTYSDTLNEKLFIVYTPDETIVYHRKEKHLPANTQLIFVDCNDYSNRNFLLDPNKKDVYQVEDYCYDHEIKKVDFEDFIKAYNEKTAKEHLDEVVERVQKEPIVWGISPSEEKYYTFKRVPSPVGDYVNLDVCKYKNGVLYVPCPDEYKGRFIGKKGANIKNFSDRFRPGRFRELKDFENLKRVQLVDAERIVTVDEIRQEIGNKYPFSWEALVAEYEKQHPDNEEELNEFLADQNAYKNDCEMVAETAKDNNEHGSIDEDAR